ncbi:MAG: cytochrome b/b6 domain-containing protein [Zetaproteobacteria bacterium]|nr:cytochrome b/b6 domain-containing protein [Zetaproteobacteria bacterium]
MSETTTQDQGYAKPIRIFHSIFALCMMTQLAVGELMDVPEVEGDHDEASISWVVPAIAHESQGMAQTGPVEESLGFEVHEYLGLTIAGLLIIRILLAMTNLPGANWRHLFPWLFAAGRKQLGDEIKLQMAGWKSMKLAPPEDGEAVARSVHGLIILSAIVMGVTGTFLYFNWSQVAEQTAMVEFVAEIHETVVNGLLALLAAHIFAVILHQRQGHNIIARIKPGA